MIFLPITTVEAGALNWFGCGLDGQREFGTAANFLHLKMFWTTS